MSKTHAVAAKEVARLINHDLSAIGHSLDEAIGRNATNPHTRSSLRDIRASLDAILKKITDMQQSSTILTQRESEILNQLALGKSAKSIAAHLVVSEPTIKSHLASLYRKLSVSNKVQAISEGKRRGLLAK